MPTRHESCSRWIASVARQSPELVRPRAGRGGGLEVSEAALPAEARAEIARRTIAALPVPAVTASELATDDAAHRQITTRALGSLTARQRQVAEARQAVLLALDAMAQVASMGRDRAVQDLVARAEAGTLADRQAEIVRRANDRSDSATVGRRTIYRWFEARERGGLVALAPAATRNPAQAPVWFDRFLEFYRQPSKPSVAEALRAFCRTLPPDAARPTERQARDCLRRLPTIERLQRREGKLALKARLAYTARDTSDLLPTSVYVGDGKTFDAEVAHPIHGQPFRPELTTIVDVATRRIVGWSAALDESTHAVVDALRRACGEAGIPAIFYTDRGPGYRNEAMTGPLTGFLARAGITPMHALPYNSQAKGIVERVNQIYGPAARALPTYLGREMDREAKLLVYKATRRDLATTGASRLLPSWPAFLDLIEETIRGYNSRPHSGLPKVRDEQIGRQRHMTPDEAWALKCADFAPVVPDPAELEDMFRPYVLRRTRRALVEWLGNSYFAPELEPLDGRDVVVGYDIRDASRVWVREIDEVDGERMPGRLIAIAAFEGHKTRYVPLTAERAAMERRAKGRLGRLQRKLDVVGQELRPAALLDLSPAVETPTIEVRPVEIAPVEVATPRAPAQISAPAPVTIGGRPVFRDDVSYCRWLAENQDQVTQSDIELLRDLLTTHSTNELLRMSGVDLVALRQLARSPRTAGAA